MIVTLTMNPAIDKSTSVDKLIPEAKLRCAAIRNEPGGGGINVSKALKKLECDSLAIFPCGGHNGNMLMDLLKIETVKYQAIPAEQETRENFVVLETSSNKQFRFGMPGLPLNRKIEEQCLEILSSLNPKPSFIVASGSLPEGIDEGFYGKVGNLSRALSAKFILDTSGTPLKKALEGGAFLIKPNLGELSRLSGKEKIEMNEIKDLAMQIVKKEQCEIVVVSLGAEGAWLFSKDYDERVPAPKVRKQSTVGAGDSMVAGMVWMLSQNASLREIVRFGVACGAAATMNPGTQLFHAEDAQMLFGQLNV